MRLALFMTILLFLPITLSAQDLQLEEMAREEGVTLEPEATPESEEQELERTKEEIDALLEELKGIDDTRSRLEESRDELRRIIISNNENTAIKMLQAIAAASAAFYSAHQPNYVPFSLKDLKGSIPEELIKATDTASALYGYYYKYNYGTKSTFTVTAIPAKKGQTGQRSFVIDQSGAIIDADTKTALSDKNGQ